MCCIWLVLLCAELWLSLALCWCCCGDGDGIGSEVGGGVSAGEVRDLEVGAFLIVGDRAFW